MDLASAEAEIRHVFGDTLITEASIGAAPPDILVKLSGLCCRYFGISYKEIRHKRKYAQITMKQIHDKLPTNNTQFHLSRCCLNNGLMFSITNGV